MLVDNTASHSLPNHYKELAEAGFDLVSSNKIANTRPYSEYLELRDTLARYRKSYRYETNVGAGLPSSITYAYYTYRATALHGSEGYSPACSALYSTS